MNSVLTFSLLFQVMCSNNLEYYVSPNYFFAGRNTAEREMLLSYHIHNPVDYIIDWMEMGSRPKYFVCDGDWFSDISFWQPLVAFGLLVKVIECCCPQALLTVRREHRGRSIPHTWVAIAEQFNQLTDWQHKQVHKDYEKDYIQQVS